jgi:4-amino-4-deoxy-L-arabinose transferase-like glycosyltransferase
MRTIGRLIRQPGFILAVVNFCVGLVWMTVILPLDAPDSPAHLQAIMQVRKHNILPREELHPSSDSAGEIILPPRDPQTLAYIRMIRQELPVNDHYVAIPYKSVQPPLYYIIAGLVAHIAPPDPQTVMYIGRVVAILLGAGTVYLCWLIIRELAPNSPILATAAAAVIALLPQFCFTNAHLSNDSAVNLAATAAFYVWMRGLRHPDFDPRLFGAGAMVGLALLCKLTAFVLIPGLLLVIVFRLAQVGPSVSGIGQWLKRALKMITGATMGVVLVSGWWFVRNLFVYGEPSGTRAELRMVTTNFTKADFSKPGTARDLVRYTLENLWGRFGWNDITLPQRLYHFCNTTALVLVSLSILVTISALALWITQRRPADRVAWQGLSIYFVTGLTLTIGFVQYNARVAYQPQARYFFIILPLLALLVTVGLYGILATRLLRLAGVGALLVAFGLLNVSALVTVKQAGPAHGGVRRSRRKYACNCSAWRQAHFHWLSSSSILKCQGPAIYV